MSGVMVFVVAIPHCIICFSLLVVFIMYLPAPIVTVSLVVSYRGWTSLLNGPHLQYLHLRILEYSMCRMDQNLSWKTRFGIMG